MPAATLAADPFETLNPAQRRAVEHGDGALLVLAGAGSGKTATLAARVARLVRDGADPQRLLLLSFSRRAAQALGARAARVLQQALGAPAGAPPLVLPWAGTFHAVAARLLRDAAPALGLAPGFTVVDRPDATELMARERTRLGLAEVHARFPLAATCLAIHSRAVNAERPLEGLLDEAWPWCRPSAPALRRLFGAYAEAKRRLALLDYDDLLLAWAEALDDPRVAAAMAARFDHVLVDEYQDTNRLQARILERLVPGGRGLTVVGDDAQAIYGFRAADRRQILGFAQRFGAHTVALEQNYRSTPAILAAANALIAEAPDGLPKALWSAGPDGPRPRLVTVADEAAQAAWVADEVLALREQGLALRRQAVLFRAGAHAIALEFELLRRRIPFVKYGGLRFLEAAHVKDLLSLLRWSQNPRHLLAAQRCAGLVPGLGPVAVRRLVDALEAATDPAAAVAGYVPPRSAQAEWLRLAALWTGLHRGHPAWPEAYDAALAWLRPQLERRHDDAAVRLADLEQLGRLARAQPSRERFLAELTLDPPEATGDEAGPPLRDEDHLVLSTLHAAKGQEWSAVHILAVVDGCLPADLATGRAEEVEEERRLLYVGMTRARRHLNLLLPQRFHLTQQHRHGDAHVYAGPSRFLTPRVRACCDVEGPPGAAEPRGLALAPGTLDLAARLASRWG